MANPRLPTTVRPLGYDITLRTDFDSARPTFAAVVRTTLYVQESTHLLVFHTGSSLSLGSASVISTDVSHSPAQQDVYRSYDTSIGRVSLHFQHELRAGSQLILTIHYTGILESTMRGYYYASTVIDGKPVKYSACMFAPISARHAFPCWDEPALKATFLMNLVSRPEMVNLFNMPVIAEVPCPEEITHSLGPQGGDWKITRFEKTPPMSTYLAAWATGPFHSISSSYTSPISGVTRPLRVYGTLDLLEHAQHALEVTAQVMPIYERMFDIEFPLPKLDVLLSIVAAGGMENWGLIMASAWAYRVDPSRVDVAQRLAVTSLHSHEVAHQWFGDITTMRWWDNTYLNEGFATWASTHAMGQLHPAYDMDARFVVKSLYGPAGALIADAKLTSHPIEVPIPTEGTIEQVFDAVAYKKGASLLRMCAGYVGIEVFLKGVSLYLKRHLYGNATSAELWEAVSEVAGIDLSTLLKEWLGQTGYPVLTVSEKCGKIHVQQNRFWERGRVAEEKDHVIWKIPLFILLRKKNGGTYTDRSYVLAGRSTSLKIPAEDFLKLNSRALGLYRVHYTGKLFERIKQEAARHHSSLTPSDRVSLVSDTVALAKAGIVPTSQALEIINMLRCTCEQDYFVLETMATALDEMRLLWRGDVAISLGLNLFQQEVFTPHVRRLGFEPIAGEPMTDDQIRQVAIRMAATAGEVSTVRELIERVERFLSKGQKSEIPLGIALTAFSTAVRVCGRQMFEVVKVVMSESQDPNARLRYIQALGASPDSSCLAQMLHELTKDGNIQDLLIFITECAHNGQASLVSKFYMDHYAEMIRISFGVGVAQADAMQVCFGYLKARVEHDAVVRFFAEKDKGKLDLGLNQALENILSNEAWLLGSSKDVQDWLNKRQTTI